MTVCGNFNGVYLLQRRDEHCGHGCALCALASSLAAVVFFFFSLRTPRTHTLAYERTHTTTNCERITICRCAYTKYLRPRRKPVAITQSILLSSSKLQDGYYAYIIIIMMVIIVIILCSRVVHVTRRGTISRRAFAF